MCFYSQEQSGTCVPACVRTVMALGGHPIPSEPEVVKVLGQPPYASFDRAAALGTHHRVGIDADLELLEAYAPRGFACVVVARAAYEHGISGGLQTRFGSLHGGHHAVVVCGRDVSGFQVFDPYFDPAGQPRAVPVLTFVNDWWVSGIFVGR